MVGVVPVALRDGPESAYFRSPWCRAGQGDRPAVTVVRIGSV